MKFDLSRFKKVSHDKHSAVLEHPKGHKITIAMAGLAPKHRAALAALPMAEGGEVSSGFPKIEVQKGQFDKDAAKLAGGKPKPQMFANGGRAETADSKIKYESTQPPVTPRKVDAQGYDNMGYKVPVNVRKEHIRQANEALENEPRKMYAEGTTEVSKDDEKAPVVINIGGQGSQQLPPEMLNPNPGAQAKAQADMPQTMSPERRAALNPGELPFGVTPDMVAPSQTPQNAPGMAREPQSALGMQTAPQMAPQGSPDGLKPAPASAPQAPADPFGTRAASQTFESGVGTQMAGMAGQAAETGKLGQEEAAIHARAAAANQKALSDYQAIYKDTADKIGGAIKALQEGKINPEHYMQSMSTAGKIGTLIGLVGAGFGGKESARQALAHLNRQIEKDVDAQRDAKKSVLTGYMQLLGNERDAAEMTRVFNTAAYAQQLEQAASKAKDPMAQARFLDLAGQLQQQIADRMGQYSMRKTLEGGVANGIIPPEHLIRAIVPKEEQAAATKALGEAQEGYKARDNALGAFDQVAKLQSVGNRTLSPLQSKRQIAAITGPIVAQLSKATAGRFTEQDAEMLAPLFPQFGDNDQTKAIKRQKMAELIGEKLNFPELKKWNIDPSASSRYDKDGQPRIKEMPSRR